MKALAVLVAILGLALMVVGLSALFALPVMWLWNALVPVLFHGPQVTFMQAWGLGLLCGFLFKSTGGAKSG